MEMAGTLCREIVPQISSCNRADEYAIVDVPFFEYGPARLNIYRVTLDDRPI